MGSSGTIFGVEIFQAGEARGEKYDDDYILTMARNGVRFADTLTPTVVTGHEEGTDVPAVGAVNPKNLRAEYRMVKGKPTATLVGDFDDVPVFMGEFIKSGNYRTVSAEIYPNYEGAGPTLRRVAILGGEIPQIKTLANLQDVMARQPVQTFAERITMDIEFVRQQTTPDGTILCFSEVKKSTKTPAEPATTSSPPIVPDAPGITMDQVLAGLGAHTIDTTLPGFALAPGDVLIECLRVLNTKEEMKNSDDAEEDAVEASEEETPAPGEEVPPIGDESVDDESASVDESIPTPEESAMTDEEKAAAEAKLKFEEDAKKKKVPAKFAESDALKAKWEEIDKLKAELAAAVAKANETLKFSETQKSNANKELIATRLKAASDGGRLPPAMVASFSELLETLDTKAVLKFGEESLTQLDKALKIVGEFPQIIKFGTKTKTAPDATEQDGEVYKVRRFAEQNLDNLKKSGRTVDEYVNTFKRLQANNPGYTAAELLGEAAVA